MTSFGHLLTAMVTPFTADGALDLAGARRLAAHLVDAQANDALVINGTTGEAPTTSDAEKRDLIAAVVDEVGGRAQVVAGVGTFDTAHTCELAEQAAEAGAAGLLVVTPYYSKPPQAALVEHFTTVADATDLPVMLYDIPHRSGTAIGTETMLTLAQHPRIVAVKDAKGDIAASARVLAETDLDYYSGDDAATLALLAVGGVGLVGTSTHFTGARMKDIITAFRAGRVAEALTGYRRVLPVLTGVFAAQGCSMVKAALAAAGLPAGGLRPPMRCPEPAQLEVFLGQLRAAGLD